MFLRKRHGRVVTMPWFELDECDTREERRRTSRASSGRRVSNCDDGDAS